MVLSIILGLGLTAALAGADVPEAPAVPEPQAPQAPPAATALPAGQLRGSVSYGRHAPAVGAMIIVRPESAPTPVRMATTGTNGSFAFLGLPDGVYRAEVRRDGFAPVLKTGIVVRAPFRAVVEVLLVRGEAKPEAPKEPSSEEASASLAGTIRVAGGAPLAEAKVRLTRSDDDARVLLTDGAGAFAAPALKAGRWRLDLQGAGLLPIRADLDLVGDVAIEAQLAAQPPDYRPLAQDLIVPEEAIPPPDAAP